jgi:hypothetical protein
MIIPALLVLLAALIAALICVILFWKEKKNDN